MFFFFFFFFEFLNIFLHVFISYKKKQNKRVGDVEDEDQCELRKKPQ